MNFSVKTATQSPHVASIASRAALFHSTPVSDRRRRTHWDSVTGGCHTHRGSSKRFNSNAKRIRQRESKQMLFHNANVYADHLFQSWKADDNKNDRSSTRFFKRQYWENGTKKNSNGSCESQWETFQRNRGFQFCCSDDEEVEAIFQSVFGGERYFYGYFNRAKFYWTNSSGYSNYGGSGNWRYSADDEDDTASDSDCSDFALASERRTLGLSVSGPLKLEEVKHAYRACALHWHPDRHQGPAKVAAEEKFKNCSAAYESLCEKLAMA